MPNQLPAMVEERIVAFAIAHPGFGPRRIASELRRRKWGGIVVSANGVWRCLRRHGLNTRGRRLSLVADYRAPYEPPRQPEPEPHIEFERPGELVGFDCFFRGAPARDGGRRLATDRDRLLLLCLPGPSSSSAARAIRRRGRPRSSPAGWRAS